MFVQLCREIITQSFLSHLLFILNSSLVVYIGKKYKRILNGIEKSYNRRLEITT